MKKCYENMTMDFAKVMVNFDIKRDKKHKNPYYQIQPMCHSKRTFGLFAHFFTYPVVVSSIIIF